MTNTHTHLHPCSCCMSKTCGQVSRREFMAGTSVAAGSLAMASLGALSSSAADIEYKPTPPKPLRVQPVLTVQLYSKREQTSWRPWGGIHTQQDVSDEQARIKGELDKIAADSEFQIETLPLITTNNKDEAAKVAKGDHDLLIIYAANAGLGVLEALTNPEKWTIVFVRHKSGPVYLWYEIASNRYLRKTVDDYGQLGIDAHDVVVDKLENLQWRMRALYGLKNTLGKKIVAVGGPSGWGVGGRKAPDISRDTWKMDIQTVEYPAVAEAIKKARANTSLVKRCKHEAAQYLKESGIFLDTESSSVEFVENAFVLNEVFKAMIADAGTDAFTINSCMGTIMPMSDTTACLPLSLLNDSGYNAYCESDFVVIPSGVLLHYISGLPVFLNDPTYPHDNEVTLAHCTAPRKMDGENYEPTKILSHFESDYGAAPKVEMKLGQKITVIDPDFNNQRWLGFEGEILDAPFLDICRSQIDVQINGCCDTLIEETKGFHWMVCYGNYLKEVEYALKKVGVQWKNLTKSA